MKNHLKEKLKKILSTYKLQKEASMTGTAPVATGGVQMGGDIGTTPFAFSKKGARPDTYSQVGYKLAKPVAKSKNLELENQKYGEPAYITPAVNIEPVPTYRDKNGLVQHNDPNMDPNLVGYKQGQLPVREISYKKLYDEGYNGLKYEQETQQPTTPAPQATPSQPANPQSATQSQPNVGVQLYDIQPVFSSFDTKLKNSTEALKTNLQKNIQDRTLGKKIVVRASKGYKQPEADYTINVTGVSIDYYYDRYVIIIIGREEHKQKMAKFFVKPGFKIKILGNADNLKPKDKYQLAKSKALVEPKQPSVQNTVTSDEEDNVAPSSQPTKPQSPPTQA